MDYDNIQTAVETILDWQGISKSELARRLKISPQNLTCKLKATYLNPQFLKDIAAATNSFLQIHFVDNKYKKPETEQEKLVEQLKQLNSADYQLVKQLINRLLNKDN